jgi:hypothetical protein
MITLVDVKTNDYGGSGWMISGRLDRRCPNGRFRRTSADRFWSRFGPELPRSCRS